MGAFVLPNKEIPDSADIRSFITPGKLLVVCLVRVGAQFTSVAPKRGYEAARRSAVVGLVRKSRPPIDRYHDSRSARRS